MNLVLVLTARCNAACAHCSTGCGPEHTEHLGREQLFSLMAQAAEGAHAPMRFALTGGEPFLDYELLLDLAREARRLGGDVTCVTNAYWATSAERAHALLAGAQAAGLNILAVSTSRFHQRFVRRERVERALGAARALGMDVTLKYVRSASDVVTPTEVRHWALAAGASEVQEIGLMPYLRPGATLPWSEFNLTAGLPEGPCPGAALTVRQDGAALFCCTPGAESDAFVLGDATAVPLADLKLRFEHHGRLRLLRRHGPAWFARAAIARGLGDRLRPGYTDVCDLCAHIAADPQLNALGSQLGELEEIEPIQRLLARLSGGPIPATHEGEC